MNKKDKHTRYSVYEGGAPKEYTVYEGAKKQKLKKKMIVVELLLLSPPQHTFFPPFKFAIF